MKARVKGTDDPFRDIETVEMKGVVGIYFAKDVEFEPTPDHWQDVRERTAIAAVQGYTSCECQLVGTINRAMAENIADKAIMIADALVKKLKGE